jgi:putative transposase
VVKFFGRATRWRFRQRTNLYWPQIAEFTRLPCGWKYLYRAVDKAGASVDFLLTAKRDHKAALRFLRKAIKRNGTPEKITIDKSGANIAAIESHNAEIEAGIKIHRSKYLNTFRNVRHIAFYAPRSLPATKQ